MGELCDTPDIDAGVEDATPPATDEGPDATSIDAGQPEALVDADRPHDVGAVALPSQDVYVAQDADGALTDGGRPSQPAQADGGFCAMGYRDTPLTWLMLMMLLGGWRLRTSLRMGELRKRLDAQAGSMHDAG